MPIVAGYDPNPSDNLRVEVAFEADPDAASPAWRDLTGRLDLGAGVGKTYGRGDEFSAVQPSSCSLTLNNYDGALTAGNTGSTFYPHVLPYRKIRLSYRNTDVPGNFVSESAASMESGVGDWFSSTAFGTLDTAAISSSTLHPVDGTKGGLTTWPTTAIGSMAMALVSGLVIGRTYTASIYVWVPSGSPDVKLEVLFLTSGSTTSTKNATTRISVTFTATATSHIVGPRCATATSGQLCYFDALQVDEGSTVRDFTLDAPPIDYRFTGYVEEWPVEWSGFYSQAQITATDRLSRIGAKRAMRSVIEEAILALSPQAYYPLGEPEESTKAGDVSGILGATPLSIAAVGGGSGTLTFGTATGPPTDALPAPTFTPASSTNGKHLSGGTPQLGGLSSVSLRASFLTSTAALATIVKIRDGYDAHLELNVTAAGKLQAHLYSPFAGADVFSLTSAATVSDGNTHDACVTLTQSGGTVSVVMYLDGASAGTTSFSAAALNLFNQIKIGGTQAGRAFTGTISHVAAYNSALSAANVLEVYTATSTGFEGDTSDERIARYARWAGIDDTDMVLDAGSSTSICFTDTTGQSVLQAMQDVAQTEGGRLFIDGAGRLVFHARSRSYDNAAAIATVDSDLLGPESRFVMSTQGLINDVAGARPTGPTVRAFDQTSINTYGVQDPGSLTLLVTSDTEVADAVNWRVQGNKDPQVRLPQGTFDLYTDSTGVQAQLRALELGDRVTVTGLPSQAPASSMDLIVEGYSESIGLTGWMLTANLSNYDAVQALILDDVVYGLLDGDNRLIY